MAKWTKEEQAANRAKWLEALKNGGYKQTTLYLKSYKDKKGKKCKDGAFCCLGVAVDLYLKEKHNPGDKWIEGTDFDGSVLFEGVTINKRKYGNSSLPPPVQSWLGLSNKEGEFCPQEQVNEYGTAKAVPDYEHKYLTTLNDDDGLTFKQIAKFIEKGPERLIK